jgi:hypothetical protein
MFRLYWYFFSLKLYLFKNYGVGLRRRDYLILVSECGIIGEQTGMMMNGEDTFLGFTAVYVEYNVIPKNSRPDVIAPHSLIKLTF